MGLIKNRVSPAIRFGVLVTVLAMLAAACSGDDASTNASTTDGKTGGGKASASNCDGAIEAPNTNYIVDECGRVLILRGVNVESSSKGGKQSDSHLPATGLENQDQLFRWGWNTVRFLVFWGAIEPTAGTYDEDYLDEVEKWLDFYAENDINVVLDMHQDLYGWKVGGNGAPDWATKTNGLEFVGAKGDGPWYLNATDKATQAAYQNFWDLDQGFPELQSSYLEALGHLVKRFADHPAVIGYDVMNEPVFANGDLDETLAIANQAAEGKFENPNLNQFMQRAIDAVRAVDEDSWIFVEPTSLLNAFPYPGDLKSLVDPRPVIPRLVYAGHLYETSTHDGGGYPDDSTYIDEWQSMRSEEAVQLKAALWPGEWGGSANQNGFDRYVAEVTAMLDEEMAGWSYWSWDPGGWGPLTADGKVSANGKLLLRVQPRAIAGSPDRFTWDAEERTFQLTWRSREGVQGTTDIAVPADLYPNGFEVTSTDKDGDWSFDHDAEHNVVSITASSAPSHSITITPKAGG